MARAPFKWNVVPRYTPGSPALVDEETARHVAKQEEAAYKRTLDGLYGEEAKQRAERLGLEGVVYYYTERKKTPQVTLTDVLLDELRTFRKWEDFGEWSKANRERSGW